MFFKSAHETYSNLDHISDHKTILNKFKKIKIIQNIFFDHME